MIGGPANPGNRRLFGDRRGYAYTGGMNDKNEPNEAESDNAAAAARRFIDLWQDQIGALADDQFLSEALESMLRSLSGKRIAGRDGAESNNDGDTDGKDADGNGRGRDLAPGAETAGPAPGHDMELADELRRRIAECQSRIAALES